MKSHKEKENEMFKIIRNITALIICISIFSGCSSIPRDIRDYEEELGAARLRISELEEYNRRIEDQLREFLNSSSEYAGAVDLFAESYQESIRRIEELQSSTRSEIDKLYQYLSILEENNRRTGEYLQWYSRQIRGSTED